MQNKGPGSQHAPYLLCASVVGDTRCLNGATHLRDGFGVCYTHARRAELRAHPSAVSYHLIRSMVGRQFSRDLLVGDSK